METCGIPNVTELPIVEEKFTWTTQTNFKEACDVAVLTMENKTSSAAVQLFIHQDEKGNEWEMILEKDELNPAGITVRVSRPTALIAIKGGLNPSAMKMNIFLTKGSQIEPISSVDIATTCIHPGDSQEWKLGSVSDILNKPCGEQLTVEVIVEHFDYSSILTEVNEAEEEAAAAALNNKPICDVLGSFGDLWNDGNQELSDFQLRVNGKVFYLHKAIVSVRCPLAKRMFGDGTPDGEIAEKMSQGLSRRTVEILVHFVYTGELGMRADDTVETLEELLPSIHKWEIPRVLKLVDAKIVDFVTVETAERLFELSSQFNLEAGVADISGFIARNRRVIFAVWKANRCGTGNKINI